MAKDREVRDAIRKRFVNSLSRSPALYKLVQLMWRLFARAHQPSDVFWEGRVHMTEGLQFDVPAPSEFTS
jgi:hypothetical protein